MKQISRTELIKEVSVVTGQTLKTTTEIINATLDSVISHVGLGDRVTIKGFGRFQKSSRKARVGRVPGHPEKTVDIPASEALGFKSAHKYTK